MILYSGDCVAVAILPDLSRRMRGGKCWVARRALRMASASSLPRSAAHTPQLRQQGPLRTIRHTGGSPTLAPQYGEAVALGRGYDRDRRGRGTLSGSPYGKYSARRRVK